MPRTALSDGRDLSAQSRSIVEVASGQVMDTEETTARVVELQPAAETEPRNPHKHEHMEELIYVLESEGKAWDEGEIFEVSASDTVLFEPGHRHMIVNHTDEPLRLVCFFPVADIEQDFVLDEETTFPQEEL